MMISTNIQGIQFVLGQSECAKCREWSEQHPDAIVIGQLPELASEDFFIIDGEVWCKHCLKWNVQVLLEEIGEVETINKERLEKGEKPFTIPYKGYRDYMLSIIDSWGEKVSAAERKLACHMINEGWGTVLYDLRYPVKYYPSNPIEWLEFSKCFDDPDSEPPEDESICEYCREREPEHICQKL